jgi:hypothetical protein
MEHEGNISIPSDLLDQPIFRYTRQQKIGMTSYLLCFDTGTAPALGCTIRLTPANVNNKQEQSDWRRFSHRRPPRMLTGLREARFNAACTDCCISLPATIT